MAQIMCCPLLLVGPDVIQSRTHLLDAPKDVEERVQVGVAVAIPLLGNHLAMDPNVEDVSVKIDMLVLVRMEMMTLGHRPGGMVDVSEQTTGRRDNVQRRRS